MPSKVAKDRYSKAHKKGGSKVKDDLEYDEVLDEFDQDDQDKDIGSAVQMPVFENIRSHLASPRVSALPMPLLNRNI